MLRNNSTGCRPKENWQHNPNGFALAAALAWDLSYDKVDEPAVTNLYLMVFTSQSYDSPENRRTFFLQQFGRNRSRIVFEAVCTLVFVLTIWFRGFWPVPIGFPDNGDYPKVLGRINAWPVHGQEGHTFDYLVTDYLIDPNRSWDARIPTLEVPLARCASFVSSFLLPPGHFDLRILGAAHALILALAFWILLRTFRGFSWAWSFVLAAVTLLVFTDAEYLEFLNSAFMDASAITLLVLLFSLALILSQNLPKPPWEFIVAFSMVGALFLSTKLQHQFTVIPLASFCLYLGTRTKDRSSMAAWLCGAILMIATSAWMVVHRLPDYQADSGFSLVFLKLLPLSQSPPDALRELGRPASEVRYIGMNTWSPGSPMSNNEYHDRFWRDVSPGRVMKFYGRHLGIAGRILWCDLRKSGSDIPVSELEVGLDRSTIRPYGVYRKADDPKPHQRPRILSLWSDLRRFLAISIPLLIPAIYAVCVVLALYKLCRKPDREDLRTWPLLLLLCVMGIFSFLAGSLGDATDTARHIVTYQVATDLILLLLLYQLPRAVRSAGKTG